MCLYDCIWAYLRAQDKPKSAQESPREHQESPREPQESPKRAPKIKTSRGRGGQKGFLALFPGRGNRDCACNKVCFIEAKAWVTLKAEFWSKKCRKKRLRKRRPEFAKKSLCGRFFGPEILQNRGSCVGMEPLSIKDHENEVKLRVLNSCFSPKI